MNDFLSIVIPVYTNAPTLSELHRRLSAVLQHVTDRYEILFVDDACPANSITVLRELSANDEHVVVLRLAANVGQNRAVLTGLAQVRGDVAVVMDADLQDPPEAIPALLAALTADVAAVFAGRRGAYEGRKRLITSWLFKHSLYLLSGGRIPPDAGLFVAMRREMIVSLLAFDIPQPYVVGLIGRTQLPLRSIPVLRHANDERTSAYTARKRLVLAWRALQQMLPAWMVEHKQRSVQTPVVVSEYLGGHFRPLTQAGIATLCVE